MACMEVCIDSVQSAINAERGGASRVELCANLTEGGTTPTVGMLRIVKSRVSIPVFVMIRSRGADFCYSADEVAVMKEDVKLLKEEGADGIVFGALQPSGEIDCELTREIIEVSKPLPVTFHRAFDMSRNLSKSLDDLISLGVQRVLTSGGETSVLEGLPTLTELIEQASERIIVVPGGGITERNIGRILSTCRAKEFHGSCRSSVDSSMVYRNQSLSMGASFHPPEFTTKVTSGDRVRKVLESARSS